MYTIFHIRRAFMYRLSCAAIRKAPHVAAVRVELEAWEDADGPAASTADFGHRDLQGYGLRVAGPSLRRDGYRADSGSGLGLRCGQELAWTHRSDAWVEDGFSIARGEERFPDSRR